MPQCTLTLTEQIRKCKIPFTCLNNLAGGQASSTLKGKSSVMVGKIYFTYWVIKFHFAFDYQRAVKYLSHINDLKLIFLICYLLVLLV